MFISFVALSLSMLTLPSNAYASSMSTIYADDVTLSVNTITYTYSYSGNNRIDVSCDDLRMVNDMYGTIGDYPVLTYTFDVTQDNSTTTFAIQYQFMDNYSVVSCTTYPINFYGMNGQQSYDKTLTSNIYLQNCWIRYANGNQYFGDLYYTASEYYSTDREVVTGWNLSSSTRVDSFEFGFTIAMFPPTFQLTDSDSYTNGYNNGYNQGYNEGSSSGYDTGYNAGETSGYNTGYSAGQSQGYNNGYNAGIQASNQYSFLTLFGAVADTPIMILRNLLGFEVFGFSAMSILMTMLTGVIALYLIRKLIF